MRACVRVWECHARGCAARIAALRTPTRAHPSAGLKALYFEKIRPLEEAYHFGEFYSPMWKDSDFDAKPMILLLGQYSVGKTSFIRCAHHVHARA